MIYTVTFNPSLDYLVEVKDFQLGMTNRTSYEHMLAGGKGINVSMVLGNLGYDSTALGFVAGFTGDRIQRMVSEYGIRTEFVDVGSGLSRINIKIKNIDGTEINGKGPDIPKDKLDELLAVIDRIGKEPNAAKMRDLAGDGDVGKTNHKNDRKDRLRDVLVLAGSIPAGVPDSIYCDIISKLAGRNVMTVVDATSRLLTNVLEYRPFLVKPNHHELGEIFGVKIEEKSDAVLFARKLQEKGAVNVLVSMGGQGAVLVDETGLAHEAFAPTGVLKNSVGAGDSMVAGFIAGYLESDDYEHAFRLGIAAGSASAFSENLATRGEIMDVYRRTAV